VDLEVFDVKDLIPMHCNFVDLGVVESVDCLNQGPPRTS